MYLNSYNEFDDDPQQGGIGTGNYCCVNCESDLDNDGECTNPNCRLHPNNGGYAGTHSECWDNWSLDGNKLMGG